MIALDGARALGWRLRRHALTIPRAGGIVDVAERVLAVRGWPADLAELAFGVRLAAPRLDALAEALAAGEVIRAYAFRGGSYVMTPEIARTLLAVRTTTRVWETRRWQAQGGFEVDDWRPVRQAVRDAVADGPATRAEITRHLAASPTLRHLADAAASGAGSDSLYKPLHWWGDICFGPARDGQSTFRLLGPDPLPMTPDVDRAGRRAVAQYLLAYGPVTTDNLHYWLTEGLGAPRRRVLGWLADLGEEVVEISVDGVAAHVAAETLEEMLGSAPSDDVLLLPGFDPWVMGPGTADARLVPPGSRASMSSGSNAVVHRGVVTGTWRLRGGEIGITPFDDSRPVPDAKLEAAVQRLGAVRRQELALASGPNGAVS